MKRKNYAEDCSTTITQSWSLRSNKRNGSGIM